MYLLFEFSCVFLLDDLFLEVSRIKYYSKYNIHILNRVLRERDTIICCLRLTYRYVKGRNFFEIFIFSRDLTILKTIIIYLSLKFVKKTTLYSIDNDLVFTYILKMTKL